MHALSLTLLVALAGLGTPPRNGRTPVTDTTTSTTAAELSDQEVASRVQTYLATIDTPITIAQWKALGQRAVTPLDAIVRNHGAAPSARAKAVGALSVLGGAQAQKTVLEVARSEDEPFSVRASAVRGAGLLLGKKALVKQLRPVLQGARDPTVRATAAEVLAHHAPAACDDVRVQAGREEQGIRARFARALERCGSSQP